jgi:hypothetical protein
VVILPLTASGYQIKLRVEPSQERWLTPPNSQLPKDYHDFGVIFVEVTDAQGRLADGLPVTFRLPSDWESCASLSQPQTVTQNGVARVVLDPLTTGIIRMMTQVDDATREAVFLVQSRSGPGSGAGGLALESGCQSLDGLTISAYGLLCKTFLQKHFLITPRITLDYPEDLISQPLVEVWGLKAIRVENGSVALLAAGFLLQCPEQPGAVAVATEAGMHPEIVNLQALAPDGAHDPAT